MMKTFKVLSACTVKEWAKANTRTGGTWVTRPFSNCRKAVTKMKEHGESEGHIHACQVETTTVAALLRGSIAHQLQQVQERTGQLSNPSFAVHTS